MTSYESRDQQDELDVLIVGAGFGGAYLLKLLRDAHFKVKIYEAAGSFGGVWQWNRYPGARVDCEMPYYGYSDPAVWKDWDYRERFPSHDELRRYFAHVDKVWDLSKDVSFNTKVVEARYQPDTSSWHVKTADGRTCRAKYFAACTGTSFKQYIPDWPGVKTFKGQISHSSLWPASSIDMQNKRIAVIGAGSTGIQILQESAKVASHVTQFIRTPNLAIPMRQRTISAEERFAYKGFFPGMFSYCRTTPTCLPFKSTQSKFDDSTPEQREAHWEENWTRGGFNWNIDQYTDIAVNKTANRAVYDFWAKKTRARMTDPRKRDLLAPLEPPYYVGTKRPSLEQDYYERADQDNVAIESSPITGFTETGITTADGQLHEFDIVAIATGYDAVTGGLKTMGIKGVGGVDLQDKWDDGVSTDLGLMSHSHPNMFMVYGPQAPTSFTNGPPFIEMQCEWIRDVLVKLRADGLGTIEPKAAAEEAWRKGVRDIAAPLLAVQTDSWYMGANVPGKKKEMLLYLGGVPRYEEECRAAIEDWRDFNVS